MKSFGKRARLLILSLLPVLVTLSPASRADDAQYATKQAKELLGEYKGDFFIPNVSVSRVLEEFLWPSPSVEKVDHVTIISGCRSQDCTEKAVLFFDNVENHVLGAAILNFECKLRVVTQGDLDRYTGRATFIPPGPTCLKSPELAAYVVRWGTTVTLLNSEIAVLSRLREWGQRYSVVGEQVTIVVPKNGLILGEKKRK